MKFLLLLWIAIRGTFDAAVWATAVWCVLYSFTNVVWLQCFWVFLPIHFLWNMPFLEYVRIHSKQDCRYYLRRESILVSFAIMLAPIISILPAIAAIVLLSMLQVWTNLETHWLHTWLFVACVVYHLLRRSGKRRMAVPASYSLRSRRKVREVQSFSGIYVKQAIARVVQPQPPRGSSTNDDRDRLDA
jgi:hypothetical protein